MATTKGTLSLKNTGRKPRRNKVVTPSGSTHVSYKAKRSMGETIPQFQGGTGQPQMPDFKRDMSGVSGKGIWRHEEAKRQNLLSANPKLAAESASGSGRQGFWAEESVEDQFNYEESVLETIQSRTTSEQVLAGRINAAGLSASESFISNANEAKKLLASGINPSSLQYSNLPSEKLAYMTNVAGLDIGKLTQEVVAGSNEGWAAGAHNIHTYEGPDLHEPGFNQSIREAKTYGLNQKEVKSPTEQMLSVVGAMTVSKDLANQSINKPDSVNFNTADTTKFDEQVAQSTRALADLANLYLPQGSGRKLQNEVISALGKVLPTTIGDTGRAMMDNPNKIIAWDQALPDARRMKSLVSKSTGALLSNPKVNKNNRGVVKESIKHVKGLFNASNEGGLSRTRSSDAFEAKYIADELAAGGMDVSHTVLSQEASRDMGQEFRVTTDIREAMTEGMKMLGMKSEDLRDKDKAEMLKMVIEQGLDSESSEIMSVEASKSRSQSIDVAMAQHLSKREATVLSANAAREQEKIMSQRAIGKEMGDKGLTRGKPDTTLRDRIDRELVHSSGGKIHAQSSMFAEFKRAPKENIGPTREDMQRASRGAYKAAEARAVRSTLPEVKQEAAKQAGRSSKSPSQALAEFKLNNPNLTGYISDGKDEYGNVNEAQHELWKSKRKGKLSSSLAANMGSANTEDIGKTVSKVIGEALGKEGKAFEGNMYTESGNVLEPKALDWYRKNVDSSTFETGFLENKELPGQSTTPDAISREGKRAVEVKSREDLIDPKNPIGKQMSSLRKYNMQMQHQMYVLGLDEADLVQARRGVNPNRLFSNNDKDNFRVDTFSRDEELIGRMKPIWDTVGRNADKITGMPTKDQKALAKAVEEGNIASFEKISKKHGLDDAVVGLAGGSGSGGGRGGSGGGGRSRRTLLDVWGEQHGPSSASGLVKSGLAMSRYGRVANVVGAVGSVLWDGASALNNKNLELAYTARSSGMSEDMFAEQRRMLSSQQYISGNQAAEDIRNIGLASGGMSLGFTQGAERLVDGSRGLLNFGDIATYDPTKQGSAAAMLRKLKERGANRGYTDLQMAAIAEQTGLSSAVNTEKASQDRKDMNEAFARMDENIAKLATSAGDTLGEHIGSIANNFAETLSYFGITSSDDAPVTATTEAKARYDKKGFWGTVLDETLDIPRAAAHAFGLSDNNARYSGLIFKNPEFDVSNVDAVSGRSKPVEVIVTVNENGELKAKLNQIGADTTDGRINSYDYRRGAKY